MVNSTTPSNEITLLLGNMAHGGDALARHEGQVVFVRGGVAGERVRARVTERRARFLRASVIDVLDPSPDRVAPPCPYAEVCGGCQWQHIAYPAQPAIKTAIVQEALMRLGGMAAPPVLPTLHAPAPLGYRNHVQVRPASGGRLGFRARESHRIVPIKRCLVAHPLAQERWLALRGANISFERASLRIGANTGESLVAIEATQRPDVTKLPPGSWVWMRGNAAVTLQGAPWYHEELAGRRYRVSAGSFFQVHTAQAQRLVRLVTQMLAPQPRDNVLDVYCGVGVFALQIANQVNQVLGIESAGPAIADARVNGARQRNVAWYAGAAERALAELGGRWDKAVLDPPRAGCAAEVLQHLARLQVERIVYVSCEPATLARDVARLGELGYVLERVQPVDMFPQTFHVETVSSLIAR